MMETGASIFMKNLALIQDKGELETVRILSNANISGCEAKEARRNGLTLSVNNIALHSSYNSIREAQTLAERYLTENQDQDKFILIGIGLGYLAEEFIANGKKVIAIEPDPAVLAKAVRERDFSNIINNSKLITGNSFDQINEQIKKIENISEYKIIKSSTVEKYAKSTVKQLESALSRKNTFSGQKLRILVVSPIYGGSYPVTYYCENALKQLGHKVEVLDNSVFNDARLHIDKLTRNAEHQRQVGGLFTTLMAETVTARALDIRAQLVLFMAQSPATPDVLNELRQAGIPTAMWFVEDGSLFEYGKMMAQFYDVFFHIQKGWYEEELMKAGARHIHYLPMAADPDIHKPVELTEDEKTEFGSDISHMGAGYFNRRHFFLGLIDYNFKLWGNEWGNPGALGKVLQRDGQRVSTEDTVKIFNASKININLHSSTYTQGVNPNGDFVNPRTFELAAAGGFQLCDKRSLLAELFEEGKEIVVFDDLNSCREKINYYLNHPEEARQIARNARERVLRDHTYVNRMSEALEVIFARHKIPFKDVPKNTVEDLVSEAGDDENLVNFFRSMGQPDEELTLEGIANKIKDTNNGLNETEAIFLLMNEFYGWAKEKGVV